jgi:hypothetical protein
MAMCPTWISATTGASQMLITPTETSSQHGCKPDVQFACFLPQKQVSRPFEVRFRILYTKTKKSCGIGKQHNDSDIPNGPKV